MGAPSGHLTKVGQSEGSARGLRMPLSQRACSCPLRAKPPALPGPRLGPCLLSLYLTQHRWTTSPCPSLDFCAIQGHVPVLGGLFLYQACRSVCWLIGPSLPPSLHASTCSFRINMFICTHAHIHTNFKIIWLQLPAKYVELHPDDRQLLVTN